MWKIRQEIEKAINLANGEYVDSLNYMQFKESMMNLDFLQSIRSFEKHKPLTMKSSNFVNELQEEKELLDSLWIYLNPNKNDFIQKSTLFDVLLLLMNNNTLSQRELLKLLAESIEKLFEQQEIDLMPQLMIESTYTIPETVSNKKPQQGIVEIVDKYFAKEKLSLKKFLKCFN